MNFEQFMVKLKTSPQELLFEEIMTLINLMYDFTETAFVNGDVNNDAGENSGSCRLFAFALLTHLNEEETLYCFGQYYRDVVATPEGDSHQNIRQFMKTGWSKISFSKPALVLK